MQVLQRLALVGTVGLLIALASPMAAEASGGTRAESRIGNVIADFTDCGQTASRTCLATHIKGRTFQEEVGSSETRTTEIDVTLLLVKIHGDGSVKVTPIADGSTAETVKIHGVQNGRVQSDVPLSDGTTVHVDVHFAGTGTTSVDRSSDPFPEPGCPSGQAQGRLVLQTRDANVGGTVVAHGIAEQVTSAFAAPIIFKGHGEGRCTTA
jgi:hypothetical protein